MSDVNTRPAMQGTPTVESEPFRFAAPEGVSAAAKGLALMWTLPMRATMVVLGEAMQHGRRR